MASGRAVTRAPRGARPKAGIPQDALGVDGGVAIVPIAHHVCRNGADTERIPGIKKTAHVEPRVGAQLGGEGIGHGHRATRRDLSLWVARGAGFMVRRRKTTEKQRTFEGLQPVSEEMHRHQSPGRMTRA